jgi:hypothetical protein
MPKPRLPITHQFNEWSWNKENLMSKVEFPLEQDPMGCWMWLGSISPSGPIYGARKNGQPQMTQAARIIYQQEQGIDISNYGLYKTCNNPYCVRPDHQELKPNSRRGFKHRPRPLEQYRGRDHDKTNHS